MTFNKAKGITSSITSEHRALDYFTDRYEARRTFARFLHSDPPIEKVLHFRGDGGNGKSLLLKFLRRNYCKRLPQTTWAQVRSLTDNKDFAGQFGEAKSSTVIPSATLDFGAIHNDEQPQSSYYGPWMLRNQLGAQGLRFPSYDYAIIWRLHKKNQLTKEYLRFLFPVHDELGFALALFNAIKSLIPGGDVFSTVFDIVKSIIPLSDRHMTRWFTMYMQKRNINIQDLSNIHQFDVDSADFLNLLPKLLAEDINAAMVMEEAPERIVLDLIVIYGAS